MEIQIRPATMDDYEALSPLMDEVGLLHVEAVPNRFQRPDGPFYSREQIAELVANPDISLLVAEKDGRLYGYALTYLNQIPLQPNLVPGQVAKVEEMGVAAFARREGIARLLMSAIELWARQKAARLVELNVFDFNKPAIRLYEALGYDMVFHRMDKTLDEEI